MKIALTAFAATAALACAAPALADETVSIVNAHLYTMGPQGEIASGTVTISGGKIVSVTAGSTPAKGARVIDAHGAIVTPGLIAPSSNIFATEVEAVRETRDDSSGSALSAGFDVQYALNPNSVFAPLARDGGITRAVVTPLLSGGGGGFTDNDGDEEDARAYTAGGGDPKADPPLFAGQAAVVRIAAGDPDPVMKAKVAVTLDLGEAGARHAGGSRGASLILVRSALEDARAYARNRAAFERGATRAFGLSRLDLDALIPVAEGRTPLLVRVSRAADIRQALRLASEEHVKIILEGAEEGWLVASELAAAKVPVLIDTEADLPSSFESLASRLDNAARLQAAGVQVAIMGSRDLNNLRQERINAGTAVANGMPYAAALAAVTINPARIWGVGDRVGSIEPGKDADLVVWNGDPLETSTWPTAVFVGGVSQPMTHRGLELRDRYAKPADGYPPAYH